MSCIYIIIIILFLLMLALAGTAGSILSGVTKSLPLLKGLLGN